jgi:hypothetical protein
MTLTPEEFEVLKGKLPFDDTVTPENAVDALVTTCGAAMQAETAALAFARTAGEDLEAATAELETARAQVLAFSRGGPAEPDPKFAALQDRVVGSLIDAQHAKGDTTPHVATKLRDLATGDAVAFSRTADGERMIPVADVIALFDGLKLGQPTGEQSDAQVFAASRSVAGATADEPRPNPYAAEIAAVTGGKAA